MLKIALHRRPRSVIESLRLCDRRRDSRVYIRRAGLLKQTNDRTRDSDMKSVEECAVSLCSRQARGVYIGASVNHSRTGHIIAKLGKHTPPLFSLHMPDRQPTAESVSASVAGVAGARRFARHNIWNSREKRPAGLYILADRLAHISFSSHSLFRCPVWSAGEFNYLNALLSCTLTPVRYRCCRTFGVENLAGRVRI